MICPCCGHWFETGNAWQPTVIKLSPLAACVAWQPPIVLVNVNGAHCVCPSHLRVDLAPAAAAYPQTLICFQAIS